MRSTIYLQVPTYVHGTSAARETLFHVTISIQAAYLLLHLPTLAAFLFSAHKLRTPLLHVLLSLPLSKRADHLRKRHHLERLLMLLRLEDEDPTSIHRRLEGRAYTKSEVW